MSNTVKSKDGTLIAYQKSGQGPAVVIVGGIAGDRSQQAPLAALLAKDLSRRTSPGSRGSRDGRSSSWVVRGWPRR